MSSIITAAQLRELLDTDSEIAVLDLRTPQERTTGHIARSSGVPLHDLEQRITRLVPRRHTPIVLASTRVLDERGAAILGDLGYTDVRLLPNGVDSWTEAGQRLYTGTNVLSKTLGEWIEETFGTSTVDPQTVQDWREEGRDVIVLDSRPHAEYVHHHIPGAYDTGGGAELAYRGLDTVPAPDTTIVVNCAGRTRGIVGAQSLVNTGIPNPVYSLQNGTPAWEWAGLEIVQGDEKPLDAPLHVERHLLRWAADTLAEAEAEVLDSNQVDAWLRDTAHTTYVIDIRSPEEYAASHLPGSHHVQGGQLIQTSDEHLAVQQSRVVLIDTEDHVRGASTVQWLRYLHRGPLAVHTYTPSGLTIESSDIPVPAVSTISGVELAELVGTGTATVVDLRSSNAYRRAHVPGSIHARREHLESIAGDATSPLVLVGDSSYLPHFAAAELTAPAAVLDGGIDAYPGELTAERPIYAGDIVDQTGPPPFGPERDAFYRAYFEWEYSLVPGSEGDPDFGFDRIATRTRLLR